MFERFTEAAREIVVDAQTEARGLRHRWIGCEHFLLALIRRPSPVADAFAEPDVTSEAVARALGELIPPVVTDSEALASIGIDLDEVRAHVDAAFGAGALEHAVRTKPRWRHRRRFHRADSCRDVSSRRFLAADAALPFTPRAKRCLEIAARTASPHLVRPKHLGLALVACDDTVAGEILRMLRVDMEALRTRLAGISDPS